MRKLVLILVSMIVLTGCQSLEEIYNRESEREAIHLTSGKDEIMMTQSDAAERLKSSLQNDGEAGCSILSRGNDIQGNIGINAAVMVVEIPLSGTEEGEIALQNARDVMGNELQEFIDEASATQEAIYLTEKVIGEYGVAYYHVEGNYDLLYIVPSQDSYLDEAKRDQIERFAGEELIVTATAVGTEKSMIELSFPSYQERYYSIGLNNTTAYYQVFSDKNQNIEKIRMMINQREYGYREGILEEDKVLPLKRMLQEAQVSESDSEQVTDAVIEVVNQRKSQEKGKLGDLEYRINRSDSNIYYEDLIEVVINFK